MAKKIVLLHGLFMTGGLLFPLRKRLQKAKFNCYTPTYASIRHSPQDNAAYLIPKIRQFAAGEQIDFVGHSLGGLVIRHLQDQAPNLFQGSKVITLGTPHCGSTVAAKLRPKFGIFLNKAWERGLDGQAPAWSKEIPLLSVAGTKPKGIGRFFHLFAPNQPNDGTVLQQETVCVEAVAHQTIFASHTLMLYQLETANLIIQWLAEENIPTPFHSTNG